MHGNRSIAASQEHKNENAVTCHSAIDYYNRYCSTTTQDNKSQENGCFDNDTIDNVNFLISPRYSVVSVNDDSLSVPSHHLSRVSSFAYCLNYCHSDFHSVESNNSVLDKSYKNYITPEESSQQRFFSVICNLHKQNYSSPISNSTQYHTTHYHYPNTNGTAEFSPIQELSSISSTRLWIPSSSGSSPNSCIHCDRHQSSNTDIPLIPDSFYLKSNFHQCNHNTNEYSHHRAHLSSSQSNCHSSNFIHTQCDEPKRSATNRCCLCKATSHSTVSLPISVDDSQDQPPRAASDHQQGVVSLHRIKYSVDDDDCRVSSFLDGITQKGCDETIQEENLYPKNLREAEWKAISSTGFFLVLSGLSLTLFGSYGLIFLDGTTLPGTGSQKAFQRFFISGSNVVAYGLMLWGLFLVSSGAVLFFWAHKIHRPQSKSVKKDSAKQIKNVFKVAEQKKTGDLIKMKKQQCCIHCDNNLNQVKKSDEACNIEKSANNDFQHQSFQYSRRPNSSRHISVPLVRVIV